MIQNKFSISTLDTPAILVDMDKLETNINGMAHAVAEAGLKLKPHTKIHKSPYISELQIKAGACGVSVSKIGEAAVYVEAGIKNITVVHPFYGDTKMATLKKMLLAEAEISCVVDSIKGAEAISRVGMEIGSKVPVLLKINTGVNRFGTLPGEQTLTMAKELVKIPGTEFVGILTHESAWNQPSAEEVTRVAYNSASVMAATARMLREEGIQIKDVVVGSTPTARATCRYISQFPEITELHPGAYVFGDRIYVNTFAMTEDSCAATVLVTVISRPAPDRACIDGGYKTFGADSLLVFAGRSGGFASWTPTYGSVKGRPDIKVGRLTEETGILTLGDHSRELNIGDRLEILPNHVSLAVNLHDKMYGIRNGIVEREIPVLCRGVDY